MQRLWRALTLRIVDLKEAESGFDRLIEDAERGKPFAISVDGKPVVKVSRMEKEDVDRLPKAEE
jgi:antitoxin (DNA-binding transcriptional repressor) of toxin-antitoxin stability system